MKIEPIRVLVADDHPILRDGIKYHIDKDQELVWVGEAENGVELFEKVAELLPDVLILDLSMPEFSSPVQDVRSLSKQYPKMRILVLTVYEDVELAASLIQAGARGYIVKDTLTKTLIVAIKEIAKGGIWLAPQVADALTHRNQQQVQKPSVLPKLTPPLAVPLTDREMEVLLLLKEGLSTTEMAKKLSIAKSTVKTHLKNIYPKIGVNSRTQAALYATRFL